MIKTDQLHKRYMHGLNVNFRLWLLSSLSAALCTYPRFPLQVANPFTQSTGLRCDTHAHLGESNPTKGQNCMDPTHTPRGPIPNTKTMQTVQTKPARNALGDPAFPLVETTCRQSRWTAYVERLPHTS